MPPPDVRPVPCSADLLDLAHRVLTESMDDGFCILELIFTDGVATDCYFHHVNPAFERQSGLAGATGRTARELVPDHPQSFFDAYERIARSGRPDSFEAPQDSVDRVFAVHATPLGPDHPWHLAVLFRDVKDERRAQQALRDSERRLQTLVVGMPQLVWRAGEGGHWTWASPQWTRHTGRAETDSLGHGWLDTVHPDDRDGTLALIRAAPAHGSFRAEMRIAGRDGGYRWFQSSALPLRDDAGRIVEWLGTSTDIDDLRGLQDRQEHLLAELQHRVRNILSVVRSVFSRTVEAEGSAEDIADHFKGRLDALARMQVIVTRHADGMVNLEDMIRDELLSVGAMDDEIVRIEGPETLIPSDIAESIGLALHELTTNAVKYGALKISGAKLEIVWIIDMAYGETSTLNLTWTEQGVPAVPLKPTRYGFGSELIEEALPYRLGARTKFEFRGGGLRCAMSIPLHGRGRAAG